MNAMRSLVLAGLLSISTLAATVRASEPLLLHAGKAAISIEVPAGWKVRTLEQRRANAYPLVELTPANVGALDTPFRIWLFYYKARPPVAARRTIPELGRGISERRRRKTSRRGRKPGRPAGLEASP